MPIGSGNFSSLSTSIFWQIPLTSMTYFYKTKLVFYFLHMAISKHSRSFEDFPFKKLKTLWVQTFCEKMAITTSKIVQSNSVMICDYSYNIKQACKVLRTSNLKCRRSCAYKHFNTKFFPKMQYHEWYIQINGYLKSMSSIPCYVLITNLVVTDKPTYSNSG